MRKIMPCRLGQSIYRPPKGQRTKSETSKRAPRAPSFHGLLALTPEPVAELLASALSHAHQDLAPRFELDELKNSLDDGAGLARSGGPEYNVRYLPEDSGRETARKRQGKRSQPHKSSQEGRGGRDGGKTEIDVDQGTTRSTVQRERA